MILPPTKNSETICKNIEERNPSYYEGRDEEINLKLTSLGKKALVRAALETIKEHPEIRRSVDPLSDLFEETDLSLSNRYGDLDFDASFRGLSLKAEKELYKSERPRDLNVKAILSLKASYSGYRGHVGLKSTKGDTETFIGYRQDKDDGFFGVIITIPIKIKP